MNPAFHTSVHGSLLMNAGLPDTYPGPFIRGATPCYFEDDSCMVVHQVLQGAQFRIGLLYARFTRKTRITFRVDEGLQVLYLDEGRCRLHVHGKDQRFRKQQFLLTSMAGDMIKMELSANVPVVLLQVMDLQQEDLVNAYPFVSGILSGAPGRSRGPYAARGELITATHGILQASYGPEKLPFYYRLQAGQVLFQVLEEISEREKAPALVVTEWEREGVYRARDRILRELTAHILITELAESVKMGAFRFKQVFQAEFGVGPYKYLLDARLEMARKLIEEGVPMKQAAPMAGYLITSFSTAFKKKYGYPPSKIRVRQEST